MIHEGPYALNYNESFDFYVFVLWTLFHGNFLFLLLLGVSLLGKYLKKG